MKSVRWMVHTFKRTKGMLSMVLAVYRDALHASAVSLSPNCRVRANKQLVD